MKRDREIRRVLALLFGLLFLGCLTPKAPGAASIERAPTIESPSLIGEWVIVAQTATPLVIIPLCKAIRTGTTFKFTATIFAVYVDASGTPCNSYAYKTSNNHITFIKADMRFLCTYVLTKNSLTVTSTHFFIPDESAKSGVGNKSGGVLQPVSITLKRK